MKPDAFATSVLCWCLHETMKLTLAPTPLPWLIICAIIVAMTVIHPTPQTFALALTFRLADTLYKIPFCWDSFYWCLQIDSGLYILLVYFAVAKSTLHLADRDTLAAWWATTAKYQLAFFYLAAGFWKINTSFLDPSTSCAPIFVLTLLPVLGFVPPAELAPLIAQLSPAMTIVGEMTIGVLLLMPSRKLVRLGIATALLLHIGIALTPPPNNATPFSLTCIIRLLILAPQGVSTALSEFKPSSDLSFIVGLPLIVGLQCTAIVYQRAAAYEEILPLGAMIDWWVFATAAGGMILLRALMHEAEAEDNKPNGKSSAASAISSSGATTPPKALRPAMILLAAFYGFGGPLLGSQDLGSSNMYSNLRMHAGSNHLLLPTNVLRYAFPSSYAIVRVESCTSPYINSIYPGDITAAMAPYELSLLAEAGHTAVMFNAMKARVIPDLTPHEAPFFKYTVPGIELRRLLTEARALNETFTLTYTVLEGDVGDEEWRRYSKGRTVTIKESSGKAPKCYVSCGGLRKCKCDEDEYARLPPPGYLPTKLLIFQPYPIFKSGLGGKEVVCFGP